MNIAEIRKKKKKTEKKEQLEKEKIKEEIPFPTNNTLPIPQIKEERVIEEYVDTNVENLDFIDEESFYSNIQKVKEDKEKREFLCFLLGNEEYAIDLTIAKEVLKYREITHVPKTTDIILGIISIRGEVIPVFDIKKILGIEDIQTDEKNKKLILLKIENEPVCIIIDKITQIRKIYEEQIEPTPINVSITKQEFISGVVMIDGKMVRILNIENILSY
ncbi:MAG: chemotaxis protein CheW [Proteobacteria bacterium]|nr:chemotaxis protein CheW [Pseudomonadota bacterium]